jgi:hypothetical protein
LPDFSKAERADPVIDKDLSGRSAFRGPAALDDAGLGHDDATAASW